MPVVDGEAASVDVEVQRVIAAPPDEVAAYAGDPGHAPGTGTPEPGGLSSRELLDAVRRICRELPVAGIDVVEVSPPYDHAEITAYLANRVCLEALSGLAVRKHGITHDPAGPLLEGR